jgi:hypothetical protein
MPLGLSHQSTAGKREPGRSSPCCIEALGGTEATIFDSGGGETVGCDRAGIWDCRLTDDEFF